MAKPGTYTDLPLPDEWLPVLRWLRPCNVQLNRSKVPSPAELLDIALEPLEERDQYIVFSRFGLGKTLDQVGNQFDLTRERVRQIETRALKKIRSTAPAFFDGLNAFLNQIERSGFIVADLDDRRSKFFTEATPEELWLCCFEIYVKVTSKPVATARLKTGGWITYRPKLVRAKSLKSYLEEKCRFITLEEAAKLLDIEAYDLAHGWSFFEGVYLTANGSLGWSSWPVLAFIEAIAWELALEGITEWHYSQMAKALKFVYPKRFSDIINRNVAATLSRPDATMFQYAGQRGRWQLKELGDGHKSNKEAIVAVLKESGTILHYETIHKRLKRSVRLYTVCALLERDLDFEGYGDGFYGLADQDSSRIRASNETSVDTDAIDGREFDLVELISKILAGSGHPLEKALNEEGLRKEAYQETRKEIAEDGIFDSPISENLRERILNVLQGAEQPLRSREIAKRLGEDRRSVSRCLYDDLKLKGIVTQDSQYGWFIARNHQSSL